MSCPHCLLQPATAAGDGGKISGHCHWPQADLRVPAYVIHHQRMMSCPGALRPALRACCQGSASTVSQFDEYSNNICLAAALLPQSRRRQPPLQVGGCLSQPACMLVAWVRLLQSCLALPLKHEVCSL